jgi:hypothetical protein
MFSRQHQKRPPTRKCQVNKLSRTTYGPGFPDQLAYCHSTVPPNSSTLPYGTRTLVLSYSDTVPIKYSPVTVQTTGLSPESHPEPASLNLAGRQGHGMAVPAPAHSRCLGNRTRAPRSGQHWVAAGRAGQVGNAKGENQRSQQFPHRNNTELLLLELPCPAAPNPAETLANGRMGMHVALDGHHHPWQWDPAAGPGQDPAGNLSRRGDSIRMLLPDAGCGTWALYSVYSGTSQPGLDRTTVWHGDGFVVGTVSGQKER